MSESADSAPAARASEVRRCLSLDSGCRPQRRTDHPVTKYHVQSQPRRRADRDFDEIWCVFDTDAHENLPHAIEEARQSGIAVAVSNPCFELWLVLHVREQTAYIDRHDVQRLSNDLGLSDGKRMPLP